MHRCSVRGCGAAAAFEVILYDVSPDLGDVFFDTSQLPSAKWHAFGTLGNPNWTGAFLAATLPFAVGQLVRPAASVASVP
jgi:hypothetical protein